MIFKRLWILAACLFCAGGLLRGQLTPIGRVKALDEVALFSGVPVYPPYTPGEPMPQYIGYSLSLSAKITISLHAVSQGGETSGVISITAVGIGAGNYSVKSLRNGKSKYAALGTLTEVTGTVPIPESELGPIWSAQLPVYTSGSAEFGGVGQPLPGGVNPFEISTVTIFDSNDNVLANATLTPAQNEVYSAYSSLESMLIDSHPTGTVDIRATNSNPLTGAPIVRTGALVVSGQGFPPKRKIFFDADGVNLWETRSDAEGNVAVSLIQGTNGTLPASFDLFSVKTVALRDAKGRMLAWARF